MNCRTLSPILRCSDCGSQMIELRGPVFDQALVRCGKCGAEASRWGDFLSDLGVRVARQERERRRRRLH